MAVHVGYIRRLARFEIIKKIRCQIFSSETIDPDRLKSVLRAMSESQPKVRHASPTVQMLDLGYFSRYILNKITLFVKMIMH